MKQLFSILFAFVLILTSCEVNEDKPAPIELKIELSEQTVVLGCESQECTVSVTSPDFWVATTQSEWIAISNDSGIKGTNELVFSVAENKEVEGRVGTILVQNLAGTLNAELCVEQRAFVPSEILLSSNTLQYGFDGGSIDVAISANFEYEIVANCDWMTLEPISNGIMVVVEPSVVCQKRTTEIVIYSQKYDVSKSIAVEQAPFVPYLEIEAVSTLDFDYEGGVKSLSITSNFEYEIVSDDDWVTIEKTATGIDVTVKPIYPVLNIPRATSFLISDTLYDCGQTEILISQSAKESDFQIGEMVEYSGVVGIVFYRDAEITKLVSVEQCKSSWSTEFVVVGASDCNNGVNNMAVIQSVDSWESKYPAFAWCANLGEGWYLPAYSELYDIWEVKSTLNQALEANGYVALGADYNYYYWSSTEGDNNNALKLYFATGVWDHYYKYSEYFVRAVYIF